MNLLLGVGCLILGACGGGGSTCKRACRKVESCHKQGADAAAEDTRSATTTTGTCDAIESCDEKAACQASCLLQSTCDEIAAGSATLSACLGQCHTVIPNGDDAGLVKPLTRDGGWSCTPDCAGKQCGDDGCGGSCGTCSYGSVCSFGTCASSCTPNCSGVQCGDDGCGGSCGNCGPSQTCSYGSCISTTGSNSGAICTQSTPCSGSDACMVFDEYAVSGMCLGACSTVGDPCSTSGSMLSVCALSSQSTGQLYCAFVCEVQGASYPCPNSSDYRCQVFDTTAPDVKLCMPK